jgi:hypothetical protein
MSLDRSAAPESTRWRGGKPIFSAAPPRHGIRAAAEATPHAARPIAKTATSSNWQGAVSNEPSSRNIDLLMQRRWYGTSILESVLAPISTPKYLQWPFAVKRPCFAQRRCTADFVVHDAPSLRASARFLYMAVCSLPLGSTRFAPAYGVFRTMARFVQIKLTSIFQLLQFAPIFH